MSIALVIQTYDELRRLAIAGSVVAAGDFRLKKLIDPLKQSAEKAPVFGKVADAIDRLITAPDKASGPALLELGTLVHAILYTQGETGAAGNMTDLPSVDLGVQTSSQASARVLKPLMEALTTTGSGRLEIITEAHKRNAFADLRLVNLALGALDDVYPEIADFMAREVLPIYGKAIIPELRAAMKFPGKTGDARRLKLLHRLEGAAARDLVEQAIEQGSKELKIAALECLGDSKKDLPHLIEQAGAKAKDVRIAAFTALGRVHDEEVVVELFKKALTGKEPEIAVPPASVNQNPKLREYLIAEARSQFEDLLAERDKEKLIKQLSRINEFLGVFDGRSDKDTESLLLEYFNRREQLAVLKGDAVSGADVNETIVSLMAHSGSPNLHAALTAVGPDATAEMLGYVFMVAWWSQPGDQVFDTYAPLLRIKAGAKGKRSKDVGMAKAEALQECLMDFEADGSLPSLWSGYDYRHRKFREVDCSEFAGKKLDPRWLDVAVEVGDIELAMHFARPAHQGCAKLIADTVKTRLSSKSDAYDLADLIERMFVIQHPEAIDCWIAAMQKATKKKTSYYGTHWLSSQVAKMPLESVAKVEALLPTLPERVMDEVLPHLQSLKERAAAAQK